MMMQDISEVDFLNKPEGNNGISIDLVSHDEIFEDLQRRHRKVIIINDFVANLSEGQLSRELNSLIRTHYGTDDLDTTPQCERGHIRGSFNEGVTCPICKTKVERVVDKPLESQIWIRPPEGIPAWINPHWWCLFENAFKSSTFSLIEFLTSRSYIPGGRGQTRAISRQKDIDRIVDTLNRAGVKRGMDYFYHHFDHVMDVVLSNPNIFVLKANKISYDTSDRNQTKEQICNDMREIVNRYRNCIFSHYLPFPSKLMMVSEEGSGVGYIDKNIPLAIDALKTVVMLENPKVPLSSRTVETKAMQVNQAFVNYYHMFRKDSYGGKPGMARKQQGSTRSPQSGRVVISPIASAHEYDKVVAPWSWTISMCRIQIANKLLRMHYTPQELFLFIDKCILNCHGEDGDIMEDILMTLMDESPSKGLDIALLRNPVLVRLSNQYFTIFKIIRNTNINAMMISVLAIKGPNADFDGDMVQVKLMTDNVEKRQFVRLRSHLGLMDPSHPKRINGVIVLHSESVSMVNNFLDKFRLTEEELEECDFELVDF